MSAIRRPVIYCPNASRAFRLITETAYDATRPAEDVWPPGVLHVDGAQNRNTRVPSRSWARGRGDRIDRSLLRCIMSAYGTKRTSVKRHLFVRLRRKSRHQRPPIEIYPPSDVASIARRLDAAAAAILA